MSEPVIEQALAIDDQGLVIGVYAVDANNPVVPGVNYAELVPMPDEPMPTGVMLDVPDDPEDPNSPTHQVEQLAWPTAGWQWNPHIPTFVSPGGGQANNPNNPNN